MSSVIFCPVNRKLINAQINEHCKPLSKKAFNHVAVHHQNTLEHERAKLEVGYYLRTKGYNFLSEAELKNGCRPDILVLGSGDVFAIEVLHTESEEQFSKKNASYGFKVYPVHTSGDIISQLNKIL